MKISAVEQVYFLQKLYHNKLNVKMQSIKTLKEVMLVESNDEYKLYAKTGSGWIQNDSASTNTKASTKTNTEIKKAMLGWYVGFVENTQGVHYFAFNFVRDTYPKMKAERVQMAMAHLKAAGVL